jgi:hypothetical protein
MPGPAHQAVAEVALAAPLPTERIDGVIRIDQIHDLLEFLGLRRQEFAPPQHRAVAASRVRTL